jgi:hypothetical protein
MSWPEKYPEKYLEKYYKLSKTLSKYLKWLKSMALKARQNNHHTEQNNHHSVPGLICLACTEYVAAFIQSLTILISTQTVL